MKKPVAPVIFEPPKSRPISEMERWALQDDLAGRTLWHAVRSAESRVRGTWENTLCEEAICAFEAGELVALRPRLRYFPALEDFRKAVEP